MSKGKILIVDDDEDLRIFLRTFLEEEGFTTVTATDGVEALEIARKEKPDLITLDLQMPKDTGTDFYRKMHRDEELNQIPVIVISGLSGRHLAISKPFAVFDKPIDKDKIIKAIKTAIDQ